MSTKYVSGRVKELKIGITNYSESKESLSVTGIVSATKYYGDGSNLTGTSTPGIDTGGTSFFNQVVIAGVTTFNNADVVFQGSAPSQNITFDASENDLEFSDDARLKFGNSDDLEIWHGGPNSHIKNSTGDFKIRSDSLILKRADDSEAYLKATVNKAVEIYYGMGGASAEKKIETTKEGVLVSGGTTTGSLSVTGVSTFNDDVEFKGAAYNALWDQATSKLKLYDLAQATYGDGNDLQIYSDGTTGIIKGNDKTKITGISELSVSGVSTFTGIVTTTSDLYVGGDLYLKDDLVLDNITGNSLKITGVSTFTGDAQFDGNVSIAGTLTYEDVTNVDSVGIVTAGKGVRVTTGGIVVTAGVSTFSGLVDINAGGRADTFAVEDLTSGRIVYAGAGGELQDSSNLTYDGTTLTGTYFAHFLQATELRVSTLFNVTGVSTFTSGLEVVGHTELDDVNVSGAATVVGTLTAGLIDGGSY